MSLSRQQRDQIKELRKQYKAALIKRTQNGPSTFEANLGFIKELDQIVRSLTKMVKPYFKAAQYDDNAANEAKQISQEIMRKLFNDKLQNKCKKEFAKEPRITGLNAHESGNVEQRGMYKSKTHTMTYSISFSDGNKLEWHTLDKKHVLNNMRREFDKRMASLELQSSPSLV